MNNKYDLVIAGGGTAGVSCAWNAAKRGLKTLIIEKNSFLGGSITSSLVIPAMKTSQNAINTDFYNELYNKLDYLGGAITYCDNNKGWFNPELTKIALDSLMQEEGVDIIFEASIKSVYKIPGGILSIYIDTIDGYNNLMDDDMLLLPIEARYLVDATGDAKICKKLNAEFLDIEDKFSQPNSLRFIMSGIDTKRFSDWLLNLDSDRNTTTSCTIDGKTYLSTAYTWDTSTKWALEPLFKQAISNGDLLESDSNYFQLFSVAGTVDSIGFNSPRLLDCNSKTATEQYIEARQSIYRLAQFCRKYLPGFENATISSIANSLGVRVSNLVKGKYIYKYEDLISGKKFDHPVLISNYPVDIHSDKKDSSNLEKVEVEYQLPIESLMVDGFDHLFVIGRCISAEFKAQAALRIIPSCFSMGEGLAKYIATL